MNNYNYTTLDGIKAAAEELNEKAASLGLDFDFELRLDEGVALISVWDHPKKGDYTKLWGCTTAITAKEIEYAALGAEKWLQDFLPTLEAALTEKAAKLEIELLSIRERLAKNNNA